MLQCLNSLSASLLFHISQIRYKESWGKMKDGGYQMKLDAIPFQAAKALGEIISDVGELTADTVQQEMSVTPECFCSAE